jgi:hypothetical protein
MKKFILILIVFATVLVSCRDKEKTISTTKGDAEFQKISDEFIADYLAWRPEFSVPWGFHEFDGKISDFSKASIENELSRLKKYDQILNDLDTSSLSSRMYYDFKILQHGIKNEIFYFDEMGSNCIKPAVFNQEQILKTGLPTG